jgi:hypothetical protein
MPSLKDLKNRIASVKATQKITKAMKMVAAAKLRRAQEAAEAARPYAERMTKVLAGLSAANAGNAEAPLLLSGTGKDQVHLLDRRDRRTRSGRGLQLLDHPSRPRSRAEAACPGQDGEDHHRRPQGQRHPAPHVQAKTSSTT